MAQSKIEWLRTYLENGGYVQGDSFNPWIGCTKESTGCKNCFAERENEFYKWNKAGWGKGVPRHLTSESTWKRPGKLNSKAGREGIRYKLLCSTLCDVFDAEVSTYWRGNLWRVLKHLDNLQILILTKRVGNARLMLDPDVAKSAWMGFSASDQANFDRRFKIARKDGWFDKFSIVFVSLEPLLETIVLPKAFLKYRNAWVIAGGETGVDARPTPLRAVLPLRDKCIEAGIPFFFKAWGEHRPRRIGTNKESTVLSERVGRKKAGRLLEGVEWNQMPA